MTDYLEQRQRHVKNAIDRMNREGYGLTYQDAYDAMQRAADAMPDDEFMFEAGRRSMRLEFENTIKRSVQTAVNKSVKETMSAIR